MPVLQDPCAYDDLVESAMAAAEELNGAGAGWQAVRKPIDHAMVSLAEMGAGLLHAVTRNVDPLGGSLLLGADPAGDVRRARNELQRRAAELRVAVSAGV